MLRHETYMCFVGQNNLTLAISMSGTNYCANCHLTWQFVKHTQSYNYYFTPENMSRLD